MLAEPLTRCLLYADDLMKHKEQNRKLSLEKINRTLNLLARRGDAERMHVTVQITRV